MTILTDFVEKYVDMLWNWCGISLNTFEYSCRLSLETKEKVKELNNEFIEKMFCPPNYDMRPVFKHGGFLFHEEVLDPIRDMLY